MNSNGVEPLNSQGFGVTVDTHALKSEIETNTGNGDMSPMFTAMPVFVA
mgnify:CR=1 FL=1